MFIFDNLDDFDQIDDQNDHVHVMMYIWPNVLILCYSVHIDSQNYHG